MAIHIVIFLFFVCFVEKATFLSIIYYVMLSIRDQLFCQRKGPGVPVRKRKKESFVVAEYTRILKLIIYIF